MNGENYDTTDGNRTVLTVEGTYTSGDRQGITVSHAIDFGTMQIKRNYLYKVRIALEDPAGDTYGKVTHAINVQDWTSGVTLAWAGDENLYNNSQAANFTVTGTERKLRDATLTDLEQHLVLPYNAEKSATFYVTSTSTKSGLSLTCPATAVAATAEEGGGYQCTITPQDNTYNENGEFTQKWAVTVRESALSSGSTLTFTLQNALNSSLSASFEVIGAPFASEDDIQVGDVYYSNGLWSRPEEKDMVTGVGFVDVGVVAPSVAAAIGTDAQIGTSGLYVKLYSNISAGDIYYSDGFWSSPSALTTCTNASYSSLGVLAPASIKEIEDIELCTEYCVKAYENLRVGDMYYSAGFWSRNNSTAVTAGKLTSPAAGVVVYVNSSSTAEGNALTEKNVKASGIGGHALVMCLKNNGNTKKWKDANSAYNSSQLLTYSGSTTVMSYSTHAAFYPGYARTADMASYGSSTYPAAYMAFSYTGLAAPTSSTGWFLPSAPQGANMMALTSFTTFKTLPLYVYSSTVNATYTQANLAASINASLSTAGSGNYDAFSTSVQEQYWLSSEGSTASSAWDIKFTTSANGGFQIEDSGKSTGETGNTYVRPFLAF